MIDRGVEARLHRARPLLTKFRQRAQPLQLCMIKHRAQPLLIVLPMPPQLKKGYFGTSTEERERGNFVKQKLGNWLPTPDQGLFQDDWAANLDELLKRVRVAIATNGRVQL